MPEFPQRLDEAIGAGATIVAATPRLAREILRNYALTQARRGATAWHHPHVRAWDQWLRDIGEQVLWSGYSAPTGRRRLLTPLQEAVLWERIIADGRDDQGPLNVSATAQLARRAWTVLQQWRLPDPGSAGFSTGEQQAFSAWMKTYHRLCVDQAWLDAARVIDSLVPAISSGAVPVPQHVVLTGFESFNPQQRALLRVLTSMGARLGLARAERSEVEGCRVALGDPRNELRSAVRWLRGLVAADATSRAGLVIPNLAEAYSDIERTLDEAMMPGHSVPGASDGVAIPYEIAAGRPLRKQPVIVAADHILALSMGTVSMRVLSRIVRSPFLEGGIAEAARRARFDIWLRARGSVDIDVAHLPGMLEAFRHSTGLASEAFGFEKQVLATLERGGERGARMPSAWAAAFRVLLDVFGWPGDSRVDAVQRQALRDFDNLLREFASLDAVTGTLGPTAALRQMRQLLRRRQFVFESDDAPIVVLSPEDAAPLNFDHLWISGAGSADWPAPAAAPNPFIPVEWQLECNLHDASPAARAAHRHALANRLLGSAREVVVSHDGGRAESLHADFAGLPVADPAEIGMADLTDYRRALVASTGSETIEDATGPGLQPIEALDLDDNVLALQAACPFRAFATRRLGATRPRPLRPGLLPEARVELVRMALEHMWHRIESFEVLQAALEGEHLEVQIWEVADTVLAVFERKLPVRLSRRYRALEHARLVRLLLQWLRVEAARAPFTVARTDVHDGVELAGVSFRAHVDRVDQVHGRGSAVIDYDTAPFDPDAWLGSRPDSPPLLLYSLATAEEPVAMLVGCVSDERMSLGGVQHDEDVVQGLTTYEHSELAQRAGRDWATLRLDWRSTLQALAGEFVGGDATVTPKYGARTCTTCELASLCRIGEEVPA